MKRCRKCGEMKPLEDFPTEKRRPDGRNSRCRECVNAQLRANHAKRMQSAEYRAKRQARLRAYAQANPHIGRDAMRRWRERNPETARQKATESSRRLRKRQPDYFRKWYERNAEKERERSRKVMREIRRTRPELGRAARRRYRAKHTEAIRAREREKTYARRALQPYSPELARVMAELVTQPCAYCGSTENITIDHIVPLSRGGKHEAKNLASACSACNSSKCDRLLSEWSGRT